MYFSVLGPADQLGSINTDTSVEVQLAGGLAAAAVAAGRLQEVVAGQEDAAAGRAKVACCVGTLESGEGEESDKGGELHCVIRLSLVG